MVFEYLSFEDLKQLNAKSKELVVIDGTVFPGAIHVGGNLNTMSVICHEDLADALEVIIPNVVFYRRTNSSYPVAERKLRETQRPIRRVFTLYDRPLRPEGMYLTEKEQFQNYTSLLAMHDYWGLRAAVLIALKVNDLLNTRVNVISKYGSLHSQAFQEKLIKTGHSKVKTHRPAGLIDLLADRTGLDVVLLQKKVGK